MRRRTLGRILLLAAPLTLLTAPSAQAEPRATVSDTSLVPGQVVTVSASGLLPGSTAQLAYLPEVQLGPVTVGADGAFRTDIRIPATSYDGAKQIVVDGVGADGNRAYLATNCTLAGPPVSARLSTSALRPSAPVRITGNRFLAGTAVTVVVFPEGKLLARTSADGSGDFGVDATMPELLFNGRHLIVVAGPNASGGFSWLELEATVTGGFGDAPAIRGSGQELFDEFSTTSSSSTTSTAAAPSTTRRRFAGDPSPDDQRGITLLLVVLAALVVGLALLVTWLRGPEGRRWRRRRRRSSSR